VLRTLPDNSVDSVVTDPPYGLSFMGKKWDYDVPDVDVWREALRVLKPGGHLLAFAGTRTQHRMAVRIEDAGFEIRDMIAWVYGCLDEQTEIATSEGVKPYHKTRIGDTVLCYNPENGEYSYQPILEIVDYEYSDTAYRLIGDFGEQVVSRNHRVIVERCGKEVFQLAETLGAEERVPVLENMPALRQAIYDAQQGASCTQQDVQQRLRERDDWNGECSNDTTGKAQGESNQVCGVWCGSLEAGRMVAQSDNTDMQPALQRYAAREPMGVTCQQGKGKLEAGIRNSIKDSDDRGSQPSMERRTDLSQSQGCVCKPTYKVHTLPGTFNEHGTQRRVCDGTSACCCTGDWKAIDSSGSRPPYQPRCDAKQTGKPDVVQYERTAQGIRAWGGHKTAVVRVVPFHYVGKVWCLRVPTGSFVAVRNGVAFPTGNSGFPKSLDVSKAIDKAAGAVREVTGFYDTRGLQESNKAGRSSTGITGNQNVHFHNGCDSKIASITTPATPAAQQWQGWGTALKPALEPITLARKPFACTVAENVLQHGTGALNIDASRVAVDGEENPSLARRAAAGVSGKCGMDMDSANRIKRGLPAFNKDISQFVNGNPGEHLGRWPANLIHDGSADVVAGFPDSVSTGGLTQGVGCNDGRVYVMQGKAPFLGAHAGGLGDTGSAARFFYSAKASKKDRNEGLDNIEKVIIEWSFTDGEKLWENEGQQVKLLVDTEQCPPKVIGGYGIQSNNVYAWNTLLFGSGLTGLSRKDTTFTTKTGTKLTTISKTLNYFQNLFTNESIPAANCAAENGGSHAPIAESGTLYLVTTNDLTGLALGVENVVLKTQLKISASAAHSEHPTVKPTKLMRYLCRLITPPGGIVLDPYMGSGSTGKAAMLEGFGFIGIERDADYLAIAKARIEAAQAATEFMKNPPLAPVNTAQEATQNIAQLELA